MVTICVWVFINPGSSASSKGLTQRISTSVASVASAAGCAWCSNVPKAKNRRGLLGFRTAAHNIGLAQRQRRQFIGYKRAHTTAARITHRRRAVIRIRCSAKRGIRSLIRRRGDHDAECSAYTPHHTHPRALPVRTDQTGAVYGEGHIQIFCKAMS